MRNLAVCICIVAYIEANTLYSYTSLLDGLADGGSPIIL